MPQRIRKRAPYNINAIFFVAIFLSESSNVRTTELTPHAGQKYALPITAKRDEQLSH